MINKVKNKDIIWGYTSQILNIGSGLLIIPIAAKYLSSEDLAFWYVYMALSGLVLMLEFGFQPTISRMTSYVLSGAKNLQVEGVPEKLAANQIDKQLLADLVYASKRLYLVLSLTSLLLLSVCGTLYLQTFDEFGWEQSVAWIIYILSTVINFYFTYLNGLIIGSGQQGLLYRTLAYSKVSFLLVAGPLLMNHIGLMSMAIATFISMVINRVLVFRTFKGKLAYKIIGISAKDVRLSRTLFLSSYKLGINGLGVYLIQKGSIFVSATFLGLKASASYGLTMQIIVVLTNVSTMIFSLNLPRLNSMRLLNNKSELSSLFLKTLIRVISLYLFGVCLIIFVGIPIVDKANLNTSLIPIGWLSLLLFINLLDVHHTVCANYLTTFNKVPFSDASIISGCMVILLGTMLINTTALGFGALIISQGIVQGIYNNWKWPLDTYKSLIK